MEAKKETNQNNNQPALEFDLLNSLQPQTEDEENNGLDEVFPEENKNNNEDFLLKLFSTEDEKKSDLGKNVEPTNQSSDPSQSLFSLDDLIGTNAQSTKEENLLDINIQDDYIGDNIMKYEEPKRHKRAAVKEKTIEEEEIFSAAPEESYVNSIPASTDFKSFPNKVSISETFKLDSTVTDMKESVVTADKIGEIVEQDNIHEGISDDEDEELKQQWDEFMKESEEFGIKREAEKLVETKALTESDIKTKLTPK